MSERIKKCEACEEQVLWDEMVVIVDDELYHTNCVTLYPTGYVAFINGNFLGETENDDGQEAYEILDDGEYLEDAE